MKKLLAVIGLVVMFAFSSLAIADEVKAPFTKVKEIVAAKGKDVNQNIKAIEFQCKKDENIGRVAFMTSPQGDIAIAIANKENNKAMFVGYDVDSKVYYVKYWVGMWTEANVITVEDATEFGFTVFRALVKERLL